MKSLTELYKIGRGPSSSHTMGPEKAAKLFSAENPNAESFKVVLYGSLAQTGKGHCTDKALKKTFVKPIEIEFDTKTEVPHPNTLDLTAFDGNGNELDFMRVFSVGGGAIRIDGREYVEPEDIYPHNSFTEIKNFCESNKLDLYRYTLIYEGEEIKNHYKQIWKYMQAAIEKGLSKSGVLPGGLNTERKAKILYDPLTNDESPWTRENRLVCSYAFAVA